MSLIGSGMAALALIESLESLGSESIPEGKTASFSSAGSAEFVSGDGAA